MKPESQGIIRPATHTPNKDTDNRLAAQQRAEAWEKAKPFWGRVPFIRSMGNAQYLRDISTLTGQNTSGYQFLNTALAPLDLFYITNPVSMTLGEIGSEVLASQVPDTKPVLKTVAGLGGFALGASLPSTFRAVGKFGDAFGRGFVNGMYRRQFNTPLQLIDDNISISYISPQSIQSYSTLSLPSYASSKFLPPSTYSKVNKPTWKLQSLSGYQIKSLFTGSPLEKQLSKNGTLSLKQLKTYINRNDVSDIDKELLNRVLQNHANDTHIDYNTLRQEVQEMIPQYTRVPQTKYESYGTSNLGYDFSYEKAAKKLFVQTREGNELISRRKRFPGDPIGGEIVPGEQVRSEAIAYVQAHPENFNSLNTFTFESPGIKGNAKHYDQNTLGHSRTYTTAEEPDVLHVMESQSDWAQSGGISNGVNKRRVKQALEFTKIDLESGNYGFYTKEELEQKVADLTKQLQSYELDPIKSRMVDTYLQRQLQENLKYAAENRQTKMRYPTPETAAKIEGYQLVKNNNTGIDFEIYDIEQEIQRLNQQQSQLLTEELNKIGFEVPSDKAIEMANNVVINNSTQQRINQLVNQIEQLKRSKYQFSPEHQTILKKYTDFPKQFQKLFGKKAEVRTVTDAKGNTWYEVDVPQSYLDGTAEMLFKNGGKLNERPFLYKKGGSIHIKKENRGKFTEYCGGKVTQECITKGKNSSNPKIRKRATFAANVRKFKHK